ncbi:MAG: hypothetical protein JWM56_255 [Candidatus Peribacteria bacterium]|nr:hypothetical protein [Candidatus Peribacteria bacterium]
MQKPFFLFFGLVAAVLLLIPAAEAIQVCSCNFYQNGMCYDTVCRNTTSGSNSSSSRISSSSYQDITTTVTSDYSNVRAGDTVNFTIKLRNRGNSDITTNVNALLDPNMTFVSASSNGDDSSDQVDWRSFYVYQGTTQTITLRVRISSGVRSGDTLRLRVQTDSDSAAKTIKVISGSSNCSNCSIDNNVTLSINDDRDPVRSDDALTYTIDVRNNSSYTTTVNVRGYLDSNTTFVSATENGTRLSSNNVEWTNLRLYPNDIHTLTLRVRTRTNLSSNSSLVFRAETDNTSDTETTRVDYYGNSSSSSDSTCTYYNSYTRQNYLDYCDNRHESARNR